MVRKPLVTREWLVGGSSIWKLKLINVEMQVILTAANIFLRCVHNYKHVNGVFFFFLNWRSVTAATLPAITFNCSIVNL